MQLEVDFEPQSVGNHSERLIVDYDTGMCYSLSKALSGKKGQVGHTMRISGTWLLGGMHRS
jgi:hypothetical protein